MRNLLYGEWYKWKKNKAFWICLLSASGMILLVYLTMTAAGQAMGATGDVLKETGISGMAAQFAGGGLVIIFLVILTIGLILIGMPDKGGLFFQDLLIYFGLQLLFGSAISSIVIAVCEWSRNMAAGIGITMAVIIFSPLLVQGMDLLLSALRLKISISRYWILNLMTDCPTEAFPLRFLVRGILMSVIWTLLPLAIGAAHFRKTDIG